MHSPLISSMFLGGLPAVAIVIGFGPRPEGEQAETMWVGALLVIAWTATGFVYGLIKAQTERSAVSGR